MLLKTVTHSEIKLTEQSQVARRLLTIACTVCVGREPIRCTEQFTLHSFFFIALLLICYAAFPWFHNTELPHDKTWSESEQSPHLSF